MIGGCCCTIQFLTNEINRSLTGSDKVEASKKARDFWGCSSAGRAPALQAGCQEFESPQLHHFLGL